MYKSPYNQFPMIPSVPRPIDIGGTDYSDNPDTYTFPGFDITTLQPSEKTPSTTELENVAIGQEVVPPPITNTSITVDVITEETVDGNGIFDIFMRAIKAQLTERYDEEEIDKSEFLKLYTAAMPEMMARAIEYAKVKADAAKTSAEMTKAITEAKLVAQNIAELRKTSPIDRAEKEMNILVEKFSAKKIAQETIELKANGAENRANQRQLTKKVEMEATLTQESIAEKKASINLVAVQIKELKENGSAERLLKKSQRQVQMQQASLYERQRIGFDDKRKNDTLKAVLDTYAVVASEVDSSPNVPDTMSATAINSVLLDALTDVAIPVSLNTTDNYSRNASGEITNNPATLKYYVGPTGQDDQAKLNAQIDNS